ncbi:hypothetical protein B0F90DRAFT_446198 [Multifurca ochricompacta]|uniref:Uncharacterized protein n=1 Tax=Multifurca ochricompacta TaxID=376703 RepID=A0AAD4QN64_9AGAM|nr:hypothetical protein B0F90DRAFT_446198 [Multifurca ochricompacta]
MHQDQDQDDTDSESGLPEILTLSTSSSTAKEYDRALRRFHTAEKRKIREKNRRRDEHFKAQADMRQRATATSGRGNPDLGYHEVEEDDNEEETEAGVSWSSSVEEWGGIKVTNENFQVSTVEVLEGKTEEGRQNRDPHSVGGEGDGHEDDSSALQSLPSKYLPEHFFSAAAALSKSRPANNVVARLSQTTPNTRTSRKQRLRVHPRAKDVVVGTRIVRTVPSSPASALAPSPGTTVPTTRVKKFLENALALRRASKRNSKLPLRWERRPCIPPWCTEVHDRRACHEVCTPRPTLIHRYSSVRDNIPLCTGTTHDDDD